MIKHDKTIQTYSDETLQINMYQDIFDHGCNILKAWRQAKADCDLFEVTVREVAKALAISLADSETKSA